MGRICGRADSVLLCAVVVIALVCTPAMAVAALKCYDCHGTSTTMDPRPEDTSFRNISSGGVQGSHRKHVAAPAGPASCAKCHPGSDSYTSSHRDGQIRLSPFINTSILPTPYNNRTTAFPQTSTPNLASCVNVNCHFEKSTPPWGDTPLVAPDNCNVCHGAPPADGSHGKKHGLYFGAGTTSCTKCHQDHLGEANPFAHSTSAGKRPLAVRFVTTPNSGGTYSGNVDYPNYLPSSSPPRNGTCSNLYCHSDALGRAPNELPQWSALTTTACDSCHSGRATDFRNMTSNGHGRLVGKDWIRKYPCTYCHSATVEGVPVPGKPPVDGSIIVAKHVDGVKDITVNPFWKIDGDRKSYPEPTYNPATKNCDNLYCHSDGTTDPDKVKELPWQGARTECNSCHGHERGACNVCHDGVTLFNGKILSIRNDWLPGEEWKSAMPMFSNEGANKPRANSHPRHMETSFSCDECHSQTITSGGECTLCHTGGLSGGMRGEASHLNAVYHVNKQREVSFRQGGTYNFLSTGTKSCSNTKCHTGDDPVWGASVNNEIICLSCHGVSAQPDLDDFGSFNGIKAQINLVAWKETGHGRTAAKGAYKSGNPPANFPGNPCWYCHDNNVLHKDGTNPYRLKLHTQFNNRFERECVYCHMEGKDPECLSCHNSTESLSHLLKDLPFLAAHTDPLTGKVHPDRPSHTGYVDGTTSCVATCHPTDATQHNSGAGAWTAEQKSDVKNQYMMMGVCLQCHDDDSNGKCNGCHDGSLPRYQLGFDPGTGRIKPVKARASSVHFGHKHYQDFMLSGGWSKDVNGKVTGTWKGGKFCWDCHDPHGDGNIFMVHDMVSTETDGTFGIPRKQRSVIFSQKNTGEDYAKSNGTIDGICNVCHSSGSKHYRDNGGDGHNNSYVCTKCHEHRFADSHAGQGVSCSSCHANKPVPRHSAFGLPRDCTKCHAGNVGARVDVMGQFKGSSHHVQGTAVTNRHCYECHWESTPEGLIDVKYHEGYDYKQYTSVKNAKVDLVLYGPGTRPKGYRPYSTAEGRATAVQFTAALMVRTDINTERKEAAKITNACISCHSDQNNDTIPFGDCKTPRQYAWDRQSVDARYSQKKVAKWGKYSSTQVNAKYRVSKALSAHGNAAGNQGGWDPAKGTDSAFSNSRAGFANMSSARQNVQCFDCHNSHGSKALGVTSSYVSYSGLKNGGNLKEVTAGKGGYLVNYYAKGKADGGGVVNPYNAGAGLCFDCHMTAAKGAPGTSAPPWGYSDTYNASQPIKGYRDGMRFGDRNNDPFKLAPGFKTVKTIVGGHLKASKGGVTKPVMGTIDGLCTPCHDPHGTTPTLGDNQAYAVPLLKDTWLSSPYKDDNPAPDPVGTYATAKAWGTPQYSGRKFPSTNPVANYQLDRNTFGVSTRIAEDETKFAGLCLRCHSRNALLGNYTGAVGTATGSNNAPWKSVERVHAAVKGWGKNKEHANPCSKCHQPHNSALPRLMQTNCLDYQHRGGRTEGGEAWSSLKAMAAIGAVGWRDAGCTQSVTELRGYPIASMLGGKNASPEATISCHVSRTDAPFYDRDIKNFKVRGPASGVPEAWPDGNYWNIVTPWPPK